MKSIFNIFLFYFSLNFFAQASKLEVIDKHHFIKFSDGKIINLKSALAKKSDISDLAAFSIGSSIGGSLSYFAGADSDIIMKASAFVGLIGFLENQEEVDVYVINLLLNNGSKAVVIALKDFPYEPGDKIVLVESMGLGKITLDITKYASDELTKISNRVIYYQKESATALQYKKQCVKDKEKALKKKYKKFYTSGKAKCDLLPVKLVNGDLIEAL